MIEQYCDAAFAPAARAVADGRIPGAALGLVTADGRSAVRITGSAAIVPDREALTRDHWFDLASVSKVIATTTIRTQQFFVLSDPIRFLVHVFTNHTRRISRIA